MAGTAEKVRRVKYLKKRNSRNKIVSCNKATNVSWAASRVIKRGAGSRWQALSKPKEEFIDIGVKKLLYIEFHLVSDRNIPKMEKHYIGAKPRWVWRQPLKVFFRSAKVDESIASLFRINKKSFEA